MKDPEVIELRNRFTIGICAAILFCIPAILAFNNFFGNNHSKPYKMILQKDNFVLLLESKKCSKCDMVKSVLDSKGVSYFELNIDKDDDYYKKIAKENADSNEDCLQALEVKIENLSRENNILFHKGVIKNETV